MYIDANFLITARLEAGEKGERAGRITSEIQNGKKAVTSALVIDEVMWVLRKNKRPEIIRQVVEDIYATPNFGVTSVSSAAPLLALDIMERYNLKPRDAFHVAVMRELGINEIISDDADFDKVPGIKRRKI